MLYMLRYLCNFAHNNDHFVDSMQEGKIFRDSVFNETVMITDAAEGFDGET